MGTVVTPASPQRRQAQWGRRGLLPATRRQAVQPGLTKVCLGLGPWALAICPLNTLRGHAPRVESGPARVSRLSLCGFPSVPEAAHDQPPRKRQRGRRSHLDVNQLRNVYHTWHAQGGRATVPPPHTESSRASGAGDAGEAGCVSPEPFLFPSPRGVAQRSRVSHLLAPERQGQLAPKRGWGSREGQLLEPASVSPPVKWDSPKNSPPQ